MAGLVASKIVVCQVTGGQLAVALAGHALTVVIVEVTTRHVDRFGKDG